MTKNPWSNDGKNVCRRVILGEEKDQSAERFLWIFIADDLQNFSPWASPIFFFHCPSFLLPKVPRKTIYFWVFRMVYHVWSFKMSLSLRRKSLPGEEGAQKWKPKVYWDIRGCDLSMLEFPGNLRKLKVFQWFIWSTDGVFILEEHCISQCKKSSMLKLWYLHINYQVNSYIKI